MLDKDLIAALVESDHATDGHPVLPPGSRPRLEQELPALLGNHEELLAYSRALLAEVRRLRESGCRHNEPLPEDQQELLLARGPSALGDDVLGRLMLNPMALGVIQDAIEDRVVQGHASRLAAVWVFTYTVDDECHVERHGEPKVLRGMRLLLEGLKKESD